MSLPPMKRTESTTERRSMKRRRTAEAESDSGTVYLASVDRSVYVFDTMHRPLVSALVGEDFAWRSAVALWRARRPHVWQVSQRRAWRRESAPLDAKRDRIRELAADLGISPAK
jgi:hypothetical protein